MRRLSRSRRGRNISPRLECLPPPRFPFSFSTLVQHCPDVATFAELSLHVSDIVLEVLSTRRREAERRTFIVKYNGVREVRPSITQTRQIRLFYSRWWESPRMSHPRWERARPRVDLRNERNPKIDVFAPGSLRRSRRCACFAHRDLSLSPSINYRRIVARVRVNRLLARYVSAEDALLIFTFTL